METGQQRRSFAQVLQTKQQAIPVTATTSTTTSTTAPITTSTTAPTSTTISAITSSITSSTQVLKDGQKPKLKPNPTFALYEWTISIKDSYNPVTFGVIASSVDQARQLIIEQCSTTHLQKEEDNDDGDDDGDDDSEDKPLVPTQGVACGDVNYVGPFTSFGYSVDRIQQMKNEGHMYQIISRETMSTNLKREPWRVVPIGIGTTFLFTALDG